MSLPSPCTVPPAQSLSLVQGSSMGSTHGCPPTLVCTALKPHDNPYPNYTVQMDSLGK